MTRLTLQGKSQSLRVKNPALAQAGKGEAGPEVTSLTPPHPPLCSACDWSSAQPWHQRRAILGCEAVGASGAAADPGPTWSEEPAKGSHSLSLLSGAPLP